MSKTINQEKLNASLRYLDKLGEANVERLKGTDPERARRLEQLGTLLNDQDFCRQFLACPDKQVAVRLFADYGLSLTEEDIAVLTAQVDALLEKLTANDGELGEEELEQITGGGWLHGITGGLLGTGIGVYAGTAIGSAIFPGVGTVIGGILGALIGGVGCGILTGKYGDEI